MINKIFLFIFFFKYSFSFYKKPSFIKNKYIMNKKTFLLNDFYRFNIFPRLEEPNQSGLLTWYTIGFSSDFTLKPKRITIRDIIVSPV